jgi:hypothetical protein
MTTPDDKRLAQAPIPHTAGSYQQGCRCPGCTSQHNEIQKAYGRNTRATAKSMKLQVAALTAEVEQLRAFRDRALSLAAALAASGEQAVAQ